MDAIITIVKQNVTQAELNATITKAKQLGWTVEWKAYGVE